MGIRAVALVGVGIIVAVGGSFFVLRRLSPVVSNADVHQTATSGAVPSKPWIEVVRPQVIAYADQEGKGASRVLKTGDEVETGKMIETDAAGLANIYFPDGSVLRLGAKTRVALEQVALDPTNQRLTARIALASGRVWSKVIKLLTPGSLWEVKTSQAVATVRGTAFGVIASGEKTSIIGAENSVNVHAVDPVTYEPLSAEAVIAPDILVEIKAKDLPLLKDGTKTLRAAHASQAVLADPWVMHAKEEDKKYDEKMKRLQQKGLEGAALQGEVKAGIQYEAAPAAPAEQNKTELSPEGTSAPDRTAPANNKLQHTLDIIRTPSPLRAVRLSIRTKHDLEKITEGDRIEFEAVLTLADGTVRVVTTEAEWSVVGPIGSLAGQGIFVAKLDPSVAESGSAPGAVTAIWKDPKSGESLLGKTAIFHVEARIEADTNTDG